MPAARLARLVRALMLLATSGAGAALVGCADIHPAPNDPGTGIDR